LDITRIKLEMDGVGKLSTLEEFTIVVSRILIAGKHKETNFYRPESLFSRIHNGEKFLMNRKEQQMENKTAQ